MNTQEKPPQNQLESVAQADPIGEILTANTQYLPEHIIGLCQRLKLKQQFIEYKCGRDQGEFKQRSYKFNSSSKRSENESITNEKLHLYQLQNIRKQIDFPIILQSKQPILQVVKFNTLQGQGRDYQRKNVKFPTVNQLNEQPFEYFLRDVRASSCNDYMTQNEMIPYRKSPNPPPIFRKQKQDNPIRQQQQNQQSQSSIETVQFPRIPDTVQRTSIPNRVKKNHQGIRQDESTSTSISFLFQNGTKSKLEKSIFQSQPQNISLRQPGKEKLPNDFKGNLTQNRGSETNDLGKKLQNCTSVKQGGQQINTEKAEKSKDVLKQHEPLVLPALTAKSWIIYNKLTQEVIQGKKIKKKLEVASLTKIMTFLVTYEVLKKYGLESKKIYIRISNQASEVIGTSALLKYGDLLSVHDLYYSLMLPSGNDAAQALAQGIGTYLLYEKKKLISRIKSTKILDIEFLSSEGDYFNTDTRQHEDPIDYFLIEMNNISTKLNLINTIYDSPHGLANKKNVTCALDVAILSSHCLEIQQFQDVVQCKDYSTRGMQKEGVYRNYQWKNTNKLLDKGFIGIKTGITDNAGPCLATSYRSLSNDANINVYLIIIVINCYSMDHRWDECIKLVDYGMKKFQQSKEQLTS